MSDSSDSQKINIEFLRKEAKALLKQCRDGDAAAIAISPAPRNQECRSPSAVQSATLFA